MKCVATNLSVAVLIVLMGIFSGCTSAPPAGPLTIEVTLANGAVEPSGANYTVAAGSQVTLTITSDRDDEVHVHGYDLDIEVTAGSTVTKTFTANQTGRFEIESHEPALTICTLDVR